MRAREKKFPKKKKKLQKGVSGNHAHILLAAVAYAPSLKRCEGKSPSH